MLQHFASFASALVLGLWATVLQQYHEFRVPPQNYEVPEVAIAQPTIPTPFETIVGDIVRNASSTSTRPAATSTPTLSPATPAGPLSPETPLPASPLPVPVVPVVVPTAPTVVPQVDAQLSDEALLKAAIVNIICMQEGGLRGISGSGVIIDPRGIIMTVAHVGQQFLLRDYPEQNSGTCYIRTGSPAKSAYSAEPIYVSPSWINDNPDAFFAERPRGTGEHDFAFLAITRSVSNAPLPATFPYIALAPAGTDINEGDRVGTGSYAAEFLSSSQVRSSLYPTIKFAEVSDMFTFSRSSSDIFAVAAGSAAQEGSSGGAVINEDDRLIGLITTRTVKPDLSLRTMQAITMDHVRQSFRTDMNENLDSYLRGNLSTLVQNFRGTGAGLLDVLTEAFDCTQTGNSC